MTVRPAVVEDALDIGRVHVTTWRAAYDGIVPAAHLDGLDAGRAAQRWASMLAEDEHGVLVGEIDGRVQGFASSGAYRPQDGEGPIEGLGELYAIYVDPAYQGTGLGTALHDAALDALAAAGHDEVALWVLEDNAAGRAWYSRHGWEPDGATAPWNDLVEVRLRRRAR